MLDSLLLALSIVIPVIGSVLVAYIRLSRKLERLDVKFELVWRWFKAEHGINGGGRDAA
jgi:hypothetical protein